MTIPRITRTRHGMALRADLAGADFLLPADLNLAMEVSSYRLFDKSDSSSVDRIATRASADCPQLLRTAR